MLLLQTRNPGVVYEYTVPKENATDNRQPEFRWEFADWSHCTVSCGGGTKRSQVVCVEKEAGVVDEMYCNGTTKPDDKLRSCNEHLCPARWWTGPWQHCSVSCGKNGIHRRTVICVRSLGPDEQMALEDEACKGLDKPTEVEPCRHRDPCPGEVDWIIGDWSKCPRNPCAKQVRVISCSGSNGEKCDEKSKPITERQCTKIICKPWNITEWSECTRTCGAGIQHRRVTCAHGQTCDKDDKPRSQKQCHVRACPSPTTTTTTTAATTTTTTVSTTGILQRTTLANATSLPSTTDSSPDEMGSADMFGSSSGTSDNIIHKTTDNDSHSPGSIPTASSDNKDTAKTLTKIPSNTILLGSAHIGVGDKDENHSGDVKLGEGNVDLRESENTVLLPEPDIPHKHRHNHQQRHHKNKNILIHGTGSKAHKVSKSMKINAGTPSPSNTVVAKPTSIHFEMTTQSEKSDTTPSAQPEEHGAGGKEKTVEYWWQSREWGKCSRNCGGGIKTRSVFCVRVQTGQVTHEKYCEDAEKPTEREDCHRVPCIQWQTTDWGECSASCGYAVQRRQVYCPTPNKCDVDQEPERQQECKLQACIAWVHGEWSQCSQTCGGGQQVRLVQCVNLTSQQMARGCEKLVKPKERETCNTDACPERNAAYSVTCESNEMSYRVCKMLKKLNHCDKAYVRAKCCRTCGKRERRPRKHGKRMISKR